MGRRRCLTGPFVAAKPGTDLIWPDITQAGGVGTFCGRGQPAQRLAGTLGYPGAHWGVLPAKIARGGEEGTRNKKRKGGTARVMAGRTKNRRGARPADAPGCSRCRRACRRRAGSQEGTCVAGWVSRVSTSLVEKRRERITAGGCAARCLLEPAAQGAEATRVRNARGERRRPAGTVGSRWQEEGTYTSGCAAPIPKPSPRTFFRCRRGNPRSAPTD